MRVSLIFPPSWMPSQPFLSLPSLQGFLKKEGVENISIRDLNIEIMGALLSSEKVKNTRAIIEERLSKGTVNSEYRESIDDFNSRFNWAAEVIERDNLVQNVEWAKSTLRNK